jgi:mediator of RNA polymerase II transcription subunit 14
VAEYSYLSICGGLKPGSGMPGIVMDDVDSKGRPHQTNLQDSKQWKPSLIDGGVESISRNMPAQNYSKNRNGSSRGSYGSQHHDYAPSVGLRELGSGGGGGKAKLLQYHRPPLPHISQGFFPYARLVNRAAQQCWNDLSDLISDLAEVHISDPAQFSQQPLTNGKALTNHSAGNAQKKIRMLEFAQNKRAELIKLLVLSQWSRHAAEVSELIDLQAFIRSQHQAYDGALQRLADIKRDLVRAQVANPDLKTALEVLSTGELSSMSNVSFPCVLPPHFKLVLIP